MGSKRANYCAVRKQDVEQDENSLQQPAYRSHIENESSKTAVSAG
jgi:hypothetical protein